MAGAGGVAFLIVSFATKGKTFLVPIDKFWDLRDSVPQARSSIPFSLFEELRTEVKSGNGAALDYLYVLQKLGEVAG